jgi:hypothetical protein
MLNGRRNVPDDQLVVCSGFALSRLNTSMHRAPVRMGCTRAPVRFSARQRLPQ